MGKSAPAPPNFGSLASQQTQQNRPNQTNPFGSTSWSSSADGTPQQSTSFSGALSPLAGNLEGQAANAWSTPLDNGDSARTAATTSLYDQATSRLDPQWNQREQQTNASLANMGLDPTSEAGQKTLQNFNQSRNDAYSSAENNAVSGGAQAAAEQQQLDLNSREAPLAGLTGLKSLLAMPTYGQAGDFVGAGQDQFQDQMQQFNAQGGALGGFGQLFQALSPLIQAYMKSGGGGGAGAAAPAAAPVPA